MGNAMSLNPENFTEGGGLIDDVDLVITEARFVMWDYNGKSSAGDAPCLLLKLDHEGDELLQYYSMGAAKDWMPSDDGTQLLSVGAASGIRKTSNGGIFLVALIDAGFPAEDLGDDISVLDGLQAHMIQVPAPKRPGIKEEKESKFEKTILIISEILAMPDEKKMPKGAPKKKAAGGGKKKSAPRKKTSAKEKEVETGGDEDVSAKATTAILAILEEEGSVAKKDIPGKLFKSMKADDDRNAVIKLVFDDEFLSEGPWEYEDGVLVG